MVSHEPAGTERIRQLDGALALLKALRDTATDRTEQKRCQAAWHALSMDRRALLAELAPGI